MRTNAIIWNRWNEDGDRTAYEMKKQLIDEVYCFNAACQTVKWIAKDNEKRRDNKYYERQKVIKNKIMNESPDDGLDLSFDSNFSSRNHIEWAEDCTAFVPRQS